MQTQLSVEQKNTKKSRQKLTDELESCRLDQGQRPKSVDTDFMLAQFTRHAQYTHGHVHLGHCVGDMAFEELFLHHQGRREIQNVRVLVGLDQVRNRVLFFSYRKRAVLVVGDAQDHLGFQAPAVCRPDQCTLDTIHVPLPLMLCIKSYFFTEVVWVSVRLIADAVHNIKWRYPLVSCFFDACGSIQISSYHC